MTLRWSLFLVLGGCNLILGLESPTLVETPDETCAVCSADATCASEGGVIACTCREGFEGSGRTCTDVDECQAAETCGANRTCDNTVGSFTCDCADGYAADPIAGCLPVTFATISGTRHPCAIADDGSLWCWGGHTNVWGRVDGSEAHARPHQVGTAVDWKDVRGDGRGTFCALKTDGRLFCWGTNGSGQVGNGSTEDAPMPQHIAPGTTWLAVSPFDAACGIQTDGSLWCWGRDVNDGPISRIPLRVGDGTNWRTITTGGFISPESACGLRGDGELWCFGFNTYGLFGLGEGTEDIDYPLTRVGTALWKKVAMVGAQMCAIRADDTLWCAGYNVNGAVGVDPSTAQVNTLTQIGSEAGWTHVSTQRSSTCATRAGVTYCWGQNPISDPEQPHVPKAIPEQPEAGFVELDGRCGRTALGKIYCWGSRLGGGVGDGLANEAASPVQVGTASHWSRVQPVTEGACALQTNGDLWCWGNEGVMGIGPSPVLFSPNRVVLLGSGPVVDFGVGDAATCALRNGKRFCWGRNDAGEVGDGTLVPRLSPFEGAGTWSDLAVGRRQSCGIESPSQNLFCWGENWENVIAPSGATESPVKIGTATWRSVTVSNPDFYPTGVMCGIQADGTAWCWGDNYQGQLGDGTFDRRTVPTRIGEATDWTVLSNGQETSCGIRGGALACWGSGGSGRRGTGDLTDVSTPQPVGSDTDWVDVRVGPYATCARKSSGAAACWGDNLWGTVGKGEFSAVEPLPVTLPGLWQDLGTGSTMTCGVKIDGTLWCWGLGLRGNGDTQAHVAVLVN